MTRVWHYLSLFLGAITQAKCYPTPRHRKTCNKIAEPNSSVHFRVTVQKNILLCCRSVASLALSWCFSGAALVLPWLSPVFAPALLWRPGFCADLILARAALWCCSGTALGLTWFCSCAALALLPWRCSDRALTLVWHYLSLFTGPKTQSRCYAIPRHRKTYKIHS